MSSLLFPHRPLRAGCQNGDEAPALWVQLFVGRQLRAAFVSPAEAMRAAMGLSSQFCIHIDPQLRGEWTGQELSVKAKAGDAERRLAALVRTSDMQMDEAADGGLLIFDGMHAAADVCPAQYIIAEEAAA